MRTADRFGLPPASPAIDLPAVWQRIKVLQASFAVDEARRGLTGVEIVTGTGVVTGPQQVTVDGRQTLEAAAILLATGSRPLVPAIEGLATAGFLTTDDLFADRCATVVAGWSSAVVPPGSSWRRPSTDSASP